MKLSSLTDKYLSCIPKYSPVDTAGDCHFDKKDADKALRFFETQLKFIEGEKAGQPFKLENWQKAIVCNLFGWKRPDGTRRYREAFIEVGRKNGKMLALDTPIPTPSGWSCIGELSDGDYVFNEKGLPVKVLQVHPISLTPESYLLNFSNGEKIRACSDHLWLTEARTNKVGGPYGPPKGHKKGTFVPTKKIRSTKDIYSTQRYGKRNDVNHSIDMPQPLQLEVKELPIDPYYLGLWIGDGDSDCSRLTMSDCDMAEIIPLLLKSGHKITRCKTYHNKTSRYLVQKTNNKFDAVSIKSQENLKTKLKGLRLLRNKHIPSVYLRSSFAQRLLLLQGLMDSDGYADKKGYIEFTTIKKTIAEDVSELLSTMGIKHSCREALAKLNGRVVSKKYRIQFVAFRDELPCFGLKRKLNRMYYRRECKVLPRCKTVQIVSVEPCEPVPMRCITVEGESGLYLCGKSMIPTHNTPLVAGIVLYIGFCDKEAGAQLYSSAGDREQASLIYRHCNLMIGENPSMIKNSKQYRTMKSIEFYGGKAVYKALSAESDTKHGLNAHLVINDELHIQPDRDLVDTLMTATGSRTQPLIIHITTAGYDKHSICYEKYDYARKVRDGIIDDKSFLPVIYEIDEGDDWTDPKIWHKANPNIDVSISSDYLSRECQRAKDTPGYENTFKRLHLNVWTEQDSRWLSMDKWDKCEKIEIKDLTGLPCYVGIDMSTVSDITAAVFLFPYKGGFYVVPKFWIPSVNAHNRERKDRVPYTVWARDGFITLTDGDVIDYRAVKDELMSCFSKYNVQMVAFDRWQFEALRQQLIGDGMPEDKAIGFGQGFASMTAPSKELEKLVISGMLYHNDNPVMRWMASNVCAEFDAAGNVKPSKKKSHEKIDGIVSLIMALGLAITNAPKGESVYEKRGILTF